MDNIKREDVLAGLVDDIFLDELLGDVVLVVDEEGVELWCHCLWFFVEWHGFCDVFGGEDVGLAYCHAADHHFIVILVLLCQLLELKVTVGEIHDVLEALLADRSKILRRFQLRLVDNEIQHDFFLVLTYEFTLVDRVDLIVDDVPMEYTFLSWVETLA